MGLIFSSQLVRDEFQIAIDSSVFGVASRTYSDGMGWFKAKDLLERMKDSLQREFSNGLRFEERSKCQDHDVVELNKKARKKYSCDAPLRAVRWDDDVSPVTGDAICDGYSDDCASVINPGDLYVCLTLTDRDTIDATGSYWNTHRICIPCALSEWIIVKDERRVVP